MPTFDLELILAMVIVFTNFATVIFMCFSMSKQGDERRNLILMKTCTVTFAFVVIGLVGDVIGAFFPKDSFMRDFLFDEPQNAIIQLGSMSLVFIIALIYFKRKHGN